MKTQWSLLAARYNALTRREQMIVAAAVVLGGSLLLFNFGVDPQLVRMRTASRDIVQAGAELAPLKANLVVLKTGADPDAANRQRLLQLKQQLAGNGERLAKFEAGLVPPARMQAFLEGLLARNAGVELVSFKTLPPTMLGAPPADKKPEPAAAAAVPPPAAPPVAAAKVEGIYQHGVEIRLAGGYNDLLNYLADLERMPQRVMWQSVSLKVEKYPRNVMTLRLFTLSLDADWLVV